VTISEILGGPGINPPSIGVGTGNRESPEVPLLREKGISRRTSIGTKETRPDGGGWRNCQVNLVNCAGKEKKISKAFLESREAQWDGVKEGCSGKFTRTPKIRPDAGRRGGKSVDWGPPTERKRRNESLCGEGGQGRLTIAISTISED